MADFVTHSQARARVADQLCVTHCLKENSFLNRAGFSIRASSTDDPAFIKFALDYPAYELPVDMWSRSPQPYQTPRRLALVKVPGDPRKRLALIHSSYLTHDTMNRAGNFLTHILVYEPGALTLAEALASWGAPEWRTESYEDGAPKQLAPFEGVPRGHRIDDHALTEFLTRDEPSAGYQTLDTAVFPDRAQGDPATRRLWLRQALQACHAALAPGTGRQRFYLFAEPGLTALLLYGVGRLLPANLIGTLTFSTYEPGHTSFREFDLAQVVGTYSEDPLRALELDYLTRRGYGFDTVKHRASDFPQPPALFDALVERAAAGLWDAEIADLHKLWALDDRLRPGAWGDASAIGDALTVQPFLGRLTDGGLGLNDLVALQRNDLGRQLLRSSAYQGGLWKTVHGQWFQDDVRSAFPDLIRNHLDELRTDVRALASRSPTRDWLERWRALKGLLDKDQRAAEFRALLNAFNEHGPRDSAAFGDRLELLKEWAEVANQADIPSDQSWLLVLRNSDQFATLAASGFSPRYVAKAARLLLYDPSFPANGGLLKRVPEDVLPGFLRVLLEYPDCAEIFRRLLPEFGAAAFPAYDHLFRGPLKSDPAALDVLLVGLGADDPKWLPFWREGDRLADVLDVLLPAHGQFAARFWEGYQDQIDWRVLLGDRDQLARWGVLERIGTRLGDRTPHVWAVKLRDRERLQKQLANPPGGSHAELKTACHNVLENGDTPLGLLKRYLGSEQGKHPDDLHDWLKRFARSVRGFYDNDRPALADWLAIVGECLHESRREMAHLAFFEGVVPRGRWHKLADPFRRKLDPRVVKIINAKRLWPKIRPHVVTWGSVAAGLLVVFLIGSSLLTWMSKHPSRTVTVAQNKRAAPKPVAPLQATELPQLPPDAPETPENPGGNASPSAADPTNPRAKNEKAPGSPTADTPEEPASPPPQTHPAGPETKASTDTPKAETPPPASNGTAPPKGGAPPKSSPTDPKSVAMRPADPAKETGPKTKPSVDPLARVDRDIKEDHFELALTHLDAIKGETLTDPKLSLRVPTLKKLLAHLEYRDYPMNVDDLKTTDVSRVKPKTDVESMAVFTTSRGTSLAVRTMKGSIRVSANELLKGPPYWKQAFNEAVRIGAFATSPDGRRVVWIENGTEDLYLYLYDLSKVQFKKDPRFLPNWHKEPQRMSLEDFTFNSESYPVLVVGPSRLALVGDRTGGPLVAFDYDNPDGVKRSVVANRSTPAQIVMDRQESRLVIVIPDNRALLLKYINYALKTCPNGFFNLNHDTAVLGAVFSPDGHWLATSCKDGTVFSWRMRKPSEVWERADVDAKEMTFERKSLYRHSSPITCLAFSPQGKYLAMGAEDGGVLIWGMDENQVLLHLVYKPPLKGDITDLAIKSLVFSPDGQFLAALNGKYGTVRAWVTEGWEPAPEKEDE